MRDGYSIQELIENKHKVDALRQEVAEWKDKTLRLQQNMNEQVAAAQKILAENDKLKQEIKELNLTISQYELMALETEKYS